MGRKISSIELSKFLTALQRALTSDWYWPVAGAAVIEIVVTLLTVKLLVPMSGMEQAVP